MISTRYQSMLILFAPAGIEEMFARMSKNPDRFLEIGAEHGVTFPGME